jgi:hypothetical protein
VTYTFRIRFNRSPTDTIQADASEILLPVPGDEATVALRAPTPTEPLKNAKQMVLVGDGYSTEEEALLAGARYQSALTVALARVRVGADFGARAPKGFFTEYGLEMFAAELGQRVLNNVHGLMTFSSEPKPRFATANATPLRGANPEIFQTAFETSVSATHSLTPREDLAFSLFNTSFFQPTADSRFLLLMMAIEALIDPAMRSVEACEHVDTLIKQTQQVPLAKEERDSMLGTLRWLRRESITQAGKRLAASRLGDRLYLNMPAPVFFNHSYQMRSKLVHGNLPYPTFEDVGNTVGALELFVSDLLTFPLLGPAA